MTSLTPTPERTEKENGGATTPWEARPTGQIFKDGILIGQFNSRWDAAVARDAVNERAQLVAQNEALRGALKETLATAIKDDEDWCDKDREVIERAAALLTTTPPAKA